MSGWFELSKAKNGQFYFTLKAGNAQTILTSEMYTTRAAAENGIASVQKNGAKAENYSKSQAANGKFSFNLKAANHTVIGNSQLYAAAAGRDNGIASSQANKNRTSDVKGKRV